MGLEAPESRRSQRTSSKRSRRRRVVRWALVSLGAVLLATIAWVGVRGLLAKNELEAAVPLAQQVQQQVIDGEANAAVVTFEQLDAHAQAAESLTSDVVWRAYELVPIVGPNLAVVRELASVVAQVSDEGIRPLTELAGKIDPSSLKPVNNTVDLEPLIEVQPTVHAAAVALDVAYARVDKVERSDILGVVRDAVDRLHSAVKGARDAVQSVDKAVTLLPAMLGADGPRNYLLLFQNPAELRSTGGIPGALALIHTDGGRIDLVQQASTADFTKFEQPVLDLPIETQILYGKITGQYIQDVTLTPQFPIGASLAREMWRLQFGVEVDGVIAVDPFVLGYLLDATGPLTLASGDQLSGSNAVSLLLSEVYARFPETADQDRFFAEAASAAFAHIVSGAGDPKVLIEAFARSGNERRVLVWSAHEDDQEVLEATTLSGSLPVSEPGVQRLGVYENDATAAKMDYYLSTDIAYGMENCREDGRATMVVDVTLTNIAPADAATSLPEYVTGVGAYGVAPGRISTIVSVYGPVGALNSGAEADFEGFAEHPAADSGRPVSSFQIELGPGETKTVRVTMLTEKAFSGRMETVATPGINTHVTNELVNIC